MYVGTHNDVQTSIEGGVCSHFSAHPQKMWFTLMQRQLEDPHKRIKTFPQPGQT